MTNDGDTQYCQAVIRGWSPLSSQSPTVNTVVTRNNTAHLMKASWSNWNVQMKVVWKAGLISVEMLGTHFPGWWLWRGGREDHHVGHRLGLSYGPSISSIVILTTWPVNPTSLFACYPTAVIYLVSPRVCKNRNSSRVWSIFHKLSVAWLDRWIWESLSEILFSGH